MAATLKNVSKDATGDVVLGDHRSPHPLAEMLTAQDGRTLTDVAHRALAEKDDAREGLVRQFRSMLCDHHISPEALARAAEQLQAMKVLGLDADQARLHRFPKNRSTQKGNLAEIVLAEYIVAASSFVLPVYRLRFNPNVDQSMKGDDLLAFDLDAKPARIIVGEAKFRAASSSAAVKDITDGLVRSYRVGIPISLQFVAERLFESGQGDLGRRVLDCAIQFALGNLRIDYVGMLLSDTNAARRVNAATPNSLRRLAMISLGITDPDSLVDACYDGLD